MTKIRIRWLIGLLSVALIGLVAFQFYWIREVLTVNQERFNQSVNDSLNEVTRKLSMQSDIDLYRDIVTSRANPLTQATPFRDTLRNINKTETGAQPNYQTPEEYFGSMFQFQVDEQTGFVNLTVDFDRFFGPPPGFFNSNQPQTPEGQKIALERQMNRRMNVMKQNWINHLAGSNNLFERVDPILLDTLVAQELKNNGLDIDYNYGVLHQPSGELRILSTNNRESSEDVKTSDLSVNLFPNDLTEKGYFLNIQFPDQKNYLLSQAILPLSASGVLLLIVIGCFSYAIMVILRQKKISEVKNDFINNMTHEFKTPIATVSLATEALQDDDIKGNKAFVERYVSVIQEENKRLGMQVEKVLQIASLDKKDFKLKIEDANLHQIIEKALVNINIMVEKRGGSISSQLLASKPIIEADKVHLTNIIYNLLDNANKYSPDAPKINIRTENISTGVILKISDQGIGMSKEASQKIFDKFYRVSTGNVHDVKGFGLGLSYVKNIIDMHHGSINVKSEPGKGSTFKIILPFNHG